jgi:hypothetical protein
MFKSELLVVIQREIQSRDFSSLVEDPRAAKALSVPGSTALIDHILPLMHSVDAVFFDDRVQAGKVFGIPRITLGNEHDGETQVALRTGGGLGLRESSGFGRCEQVFELLDGEALVECDGADGHVILAGGSGEILRRPWRNPRNDRTDAHRPARRAKIHHCTSSRLDRTTTSQPFHKSARPFRNVLSSRLKRAAQPHRPANEDQRFKPSCSRLPASSRRSAYTR